MWLKRTFYYTYSLFFCLRYLPFKQAIKTPILVLPFIKIGELHRGDIVLQGEIKRAMVILGFPGSEGRTNRKFYISIHNGGKLCLGGNVTMAKGTKVIIYQGQISIGDSFFCNGDCFFSCNDRITIGSNNLYGWNVDFNTTDGHVVKSNGEWGNDSGPIAIGNHVWICSNCNLSKNALISDGSIVAQNSLVLKKHLTPNTLIGGSPAKDLKTDIDWKG